LRSLEKMDVLADGLAQVLPVSLRQAARDVVERWPEGPGNPAPQVVAAELQRLSLILQDVGVGVRPRAHGFHDDLLFAVRAQLLEQLQEERFSPEEIEPVVESLEILIRSQAEETTRNATELLHSADGFQLVVEMAHDLRSPLSSILFLADTMRRGQSGETTALQRRQLGLVYSAALGLANVVNDVMELAKGGGTLRDETSQPFSVPEVVGRVMETVAPVAEEKGIELQSEISIGQYVKGHPISISRVLLNLLTNALHHTDQGSVVLTASAAGRNEVTFSVQDTGGGIPEEARGTVFEPFKRGPDSARMLFSGSGLGLAIAKSLVRAMDGEIGFETEVGQGTRFWFTVPVSPA